MQSRAIAPQVNDLTAIRDYVTWAHRHGHRPETIKHRLRVLPKISRQMPNSLLGATPDDLVRWDISILGLAPNTRRSYIDAARSFYKFALDEDLLVIDPSRRLIRPKLPRQLPRPLPSTPTMDAIDTLANGRERLTLLIMAAAGLRAIEVAKLRRADVLLTGTGPSLHVREGKGGHERIIPVPEWLAAEILTHGGKHVVIEARKGGPLTSPGIQYVARCGLDQAGIAGTPHQLRHTYLTELYSLTRDIRFVQDCAGHQSPTTTAGYVAVAGVDPGKRAAIEQLPAPPSTGGLRIVS